MVNHLTRQVFSYKMVTGDVYRLWLQPNMEVDIMCSKVQLKAETVNTTQLKTWLALVAHRIRQTVAIILILPRRTIV